MTKTLGAWTLAQRQENSKDRFVSAVGEQFGMSAEDASKALRTLLKLKLIKLDAVTGQFNLKDGRVWDAEVLKRAAEQ